MAETEAEVKEHVSHYDPVHHTEEGEEQLAQELASAHLSSTGGSTSASTQRTPATSSKAESPPPESSPLHPGVGPEAKASEMKSQVPGEPVSLGLKVLDMGRDLLQSFKPLKSVHEHVCAWHFYAHDMGRQVEAHHYCSHPSEEVRQCCLFDSDQKGARLIGVEYIISERLFRELPEEEKRYWHSHRYEVGSGLLAAPGVPGLAERQDMQKLIGTYGKTWHMWQVDRGDPLPYGPLQLMMAFTADGQVRPELVEERDRRYDISTAERAKERRELLGWPESTDPAADHWQSGTAWQTTMEQLPFKHIEPPASDSEAARAGGSVTQ